MENYGQSLNATSHYALRWVMGSLVLEWARGLWLVLSGLEQSHAGESALSILSFSPGAQVESTTLENKVKARQVRARKCYEFLTLLCFS